MKKQIDNKYFKEVFFNILKAVIILVYFILLNIAYKNIGTEFFERITQLITMGILFISIFIFELAYKKDNDKLAVFGIEVLTLAIYTITTEYIINKYNFEFKKYTYSASYIYAIYFILKGLIIYTKGKKELADKRSDIREIVQNDSPIKKEATKKNKND